MIENEDRIVYIVQVEPFGVAEKALISMLARIGKEEYEGLRYSVELGVIFKTPYNRYVIQHDDSITLMTIASIIDDTFAKMEFVLNLVKEEKYKRFFARPCRIAE